MQAKHPSLFPLLVLLVPALLGSGMHAHGSPAAETEETTEVVFETTMGSFTIQVDPARAPKTVASFLAYVDEGFYDNTLFHRVIPRFVVQGGGLEKGMLAKPTHGPIQNESDNGLTNVRGTVAMARKKNPDSAESQFFINLKHNLTLDTRRGTPGYTVFGTVTKGMEVIDKMSAVPTKTVGRFDNVPAEDIVILSAKRTGTESQEQGAESAAASMQPAAGSEQSAAEPRSEQGQASGPLDESLSFSPGEHYVVLEPPVPTADSDKIEVVAMFSYGCPQCFALEPQLEEWQERQASDIGFRRLPAAWSPATEVFARAYYAAEALGIADQAHLPLFTAVVAEQQSLSSKERLAEFFTSYGVESQRFLDTLDSDEVSARIAEAHRLADGYEPAGVPEMVVAGKYRIDRMRAGGLEEMLQVADYLIEKERTQLQTP